jgi:hypothetical protein
MSETIASEVAESGERTSGTFYKWFVLTAGTILAITGLAKIWTGLGNSKFLTVVDPIIGIRFGQLMLLVGVAEIVIALVCFFSKRQTLALGLVAWMSTNFVVYRLALLRTLIFCMVTLGTQTYAQEYSASGELITITKASPIDIGKEDKLLFYIEVIGNKYKIRVEEPMLTNWYYEYAFDGTSMIVLNHTERTNTNATSSNRKQNYFPAHIAPREIPPNDGTRAQFIWIALTSSQFFSQRKNNFLLPIWSPEDPKIHRQPFMMLGFVEMLKEKPNLPASVSYINDGFYRSYNPATKSNDVIPLAPPYDGGFTNALYQVISLTNTAKYTLPSEFVFVTYSSPVSSGMPPFERSFVRGVVTAVSDTARDRAEIIDFAGVATVADYRIQGTAKRAGQIAEYRYAAYPVSNANWLDANSLQKLKASRDLQLEIKLERGIKHKSYRRSITITFITVSLALLIWVWKKGRN